MTFEDAFCFRETQRSHTAIFNFASAYLHDLAKDGTQCVAIDPFLRLRQYPLFCAASKIYGGMTMSEKQELWDLSIKHTELMGHVLAGGRYRYKCMRFICTRVSGKAQLFHERWFTFNRMMYEARKSSGLERPLINALWECASQDLFTHREVLHTLTEVLFANLDVTSHALSWLIVLLAENPGIQTQIRNENRSVVHDSSLLSAHVLRKDTLLGMAFLETLRLKPFTAFSIPEAAVEDKFFNQYRVPKNTSIIIDTAAINISNPFWGEDRECFLPDRFRNIEKSEVSMRSRRSKTRS
jgi:cytochrome P450